MMKFTLVKLQPQSVQTANLLETDFPHILFVVKTSCLKKRIF